MASNYTQYTGKYCIIGAGVSGLTAAKNLKALGIPFDVLEREDNVGGNWYYGKASSSVYRSTHLISSRRMTEYTDFPMPASYPDFPNHAQVLAYVRSYAQHFGLYDQIQFRTSVEHIERTEDGGWELTVESPSGRSTLYYQGLIIANGHLSDPKFPNYPGEFSGQTIHSKEYRTPDLLYNRRVLIVGAGNSGCDIAVEAAQNAERVFHSTRRGYHYIPKFVFGQPADVVGELSHTLHLPRPIRRTLMQFTIRMMLGNPTRFGLPKPDHRLLESHPIVNSQMLYYVGHGDITVKPDVRELHGDHVIFADGSSEQIDLIVYATGFNIRFPFIDQRHLNWKEHGPDLYMHMFHPDYDNLFVVGLIQPDSGMFWIADFQSQAIARFIEAQIKRPQQAEAFRSLKRGPQPNIRGGAKHLATPRHYLEIDHASYRRLIKRIIAQLA